MPILPPQSLTPYDNVQNILNSARMRLNDSLDALASFGGKMLDDTEAFTQQATNTAWRRQQEFLANLGFTRLIQEIIIPSLPVVASLDPAVQCSISWTGCTDGVNFFGSPSLPQDLIFPLKVWERVSGQNACFPSQPMEQILDGMPTFQKQWANWMWEWREDTLYYPGSQLVEDFRIRYASFLPDFVDVGDDRWFNQTIPIARCQNGFAWYLCAEFCSARGDAKMALEFTQRAEDASKLIMNRDIRQKQRVNVRRQARSGPAAANRQGWGWC